MDEVHLPYQVLAQVILMDFKLTKKIKTINTSHFLFIKNWNNETSTFVFETLPSFLHSKNQKPSHSSSGKTSSEFDLLEIKIKEKTKWEGKAEQSSVHYFLKKLYKVRFPEKLPRNLFLKKITIDIIYRDYSPLLLTSQPRKLVIGGLLGENRDLHTNIWR